MTADIPNNDYEAMNNVSDSIKLFPGKVSPGKRLFARPGEADSRSRKYTHATHAVPRFMKEKSSKVKLDHIIDLMYNYPDGQPKAVRMVGK